MDSTYLLIIGPNTHIDVSEAASADPPDDAIFVVDYRRHSRAEKGRCFSWAADNSFCSLYTIINSKTYLSTLYSSSKTILFNHHLFPFNTISPSRKAQEPAVIHPLLSSFPKQRQKNKKVN